MLNREQNLLSFHHHAEGADLCIVEGSAGLFDGRDGKSEAGSTAEIAKWLQSPVILVLDTFEVGRSAAAMLKGYQAFDSSVRLEGLLLNRVVDNQHTLRLREAVESADIDVHVLGGVLKVKLANLLAPMRSDALREHSSTAGILWTLVTAE
jgi:cobyrinic acid a,c-diamide synthase